MKRHQKVPLLFHRLWSGLDVFINQGHLDPSYEDRPAAGAEELLNHGKEGVRNNWESRANSALQRVINREIPIKINVHAPALNFRKPTSSSQTGFRPPALPSSRHQPRLPATAALPPSGSSPPVHLTTGRWTAA